MKLQSPKCPWCGGNCLSRVQCLRWYCFDAVDCWGSSWCSSANSAEAASLTAAEKRICSLAVCRSNETAPRGRRICQPGHDDSEEDGVQANRSQPVMPQYTERVQRLRAAIDDLANMVRRWQPRQVTCDGHSKNFKWVLASDAEQLWRRCCCCFPPRISKDDFSCLCHIQP